MLRGLLGDRAPDSLADTSAELSLRCLRLLAADTPLSARLAAPPDIAEGLPTDECAYTGHPCIGGEMECLRCGVVVPADVMEALASAEEDEGDLRVIRGLFAPGGALCCPRCGCLASNAFQGIL
eukprot:gnl/Dysnectes_brevis/24576_a77812_38.p1 GENE.gnl/Dysnectes_brevis/24576_a77812_38~~gnl/Dysnectes_brevis/24576_a77812_38.p1  ORF type:complete len:124 (+),score=37.53 gnl/Dysnectes_brevis/24576_a77812_38:2-373(+)